MPLTGTAASGNQQDQSVARIGRVHLEVPRDTDRPGKFASCSAPGGTVRSAHDRHPLRCGKLAHQPRCVRSRSPRSRLRFHYRTILNIQFGHPLAPTGSIYRPTLGKKQPQRQRDRNFASRRRRRYRVWQMAVLPSAEGYAQPDASRMRAFLWVSQYRRSPARHRGRRRSLSASTSRSVSTGVASPDPARNEVVQLIMLPETEDAPAVGCECFLRSPGPNISPDTSSGRVCRRAL